MRFQQNITAAINSELDSNTLSKCQDNMFDTRLQQEDCLAKMGVLSGPLIALVGHGVDLVQPLMVDWSVNGVVFQPLLKNKTNAAYNIVADLMTVSDERMSAGLRFSHVLRSESIFMLTKFVSDESSLPNLQIITNLFTSQTLICLIVVTTMLLLLHVTRHYLLTNTAARFNDVQTATMAVFTLFLSIVYQALIAQNLLVDEPINTEKVVFDTLIRVANGNGKLYFTSNGATSEYFLGGKTDLCKAIQTIDRNGQLDFENNMTKLMSSILTDNDILIGSDSWLMSLTRSTFNTNHGCLNYQFHELNTGDPLWNSLVLAPDLDQHFVNELNFEIALRFDFLREIQYRVINNLTQECEEHFNPSLRATVGFAELRLSVVSGAFWFLGGLILVAVSAFVVEVVCVNKRKITPEPLESDDMSPEIIKDELQDHYANLEKIIKTREQLNRAKVMIDEMTSVVEFP